MLLLSKSDEGEPGSFVRFFQFESTRETGTHPQSTVQDIVHIQAH